MQLPTTVRRRLDTTRTMPALEETAPTLAAPAVRPVVVVVLRIPMLPLEHRDTLPNPLALPGTRTPLLNPLLRLLPPPSPTLLHLPRVLFPRRRSQVQFRPTYLLLARRAGVPASVPPAGSTYLYQAGSCNTKVDQQETHGLLTARFYPSAVPTSIRPPPPR